MDEPNVYNYFYKITNLINKKFYYGIRSCNCDPEDDPYVGSGKILHRAYKKYGVNNFKKDILRVLPTREDASDLERWIVDLEMVRNPMCYNVVLGGDFSKTGSGVTLGLSVVIDKITGERVVIPQDEFYENRDRYKGLNKDYLSVYDKETDSNKKIHISEYYSNKDRYIPAISLNGGIGSIRAVDSLGNVISVKYNDPRILSGELKKAPKTKHVSSDEVSKRIPDGKKRYYRETGAKSPEYGVRRTYVNNGVIHKKVLDEDIPKYLSDNWVLGRLESDLSRKVHSEMMKNKKGKTKVMTNGISNRQVKIEEIEKFSNEGWWLGMTWNPSITKRRSVNNGIECKIVPESEIDKWLALGWKLGGLPKRRNKNK